jgi:hypothetical protein
MDFKITHMHIYVSILHGKAITAKKLFERYIFRLYIYSKL